MTAGEIRHERAGAANDVLLVTLHREAKANAYTSRMIADLGALLDRSLADTSIRAAVVTGAGASFCAGADLGELAKRSPEDSLTLASRDLFDRWARAPWPTVAAVDGPAMGGGFELALACDLRVASPKARFALPELRRGVLPAAGGIRRLVSELGVARCKEVVLFGKQLDAATALAWGVVAEVADDPVARAVALAEAARGPDAMGFTVAKMLFEDCTGAAGGRHAEAIAQALFYGRRRWSEVTP